MTEAKPTDKSPEELRAELSAKRAELGDTVEELAHRVDVPAQVKAKKAETVAKLQDAKTEASRRYVMLPGRKQRIEIPSASLTGHTIVRPARFGTVMTASSGTSIHWPSSRTR